MRFSPVLWFVVILSVLASASPVAQTPGVAGESARRPDLGSKQDLDPRNLSPHSGIGLKAAIQRALSARPGMAVEAELEGEQVNGRLHVVYEVSVITPEHQLVEVLVDPKTGEILAQQPETEPDDVQELQRFENLLWHTELSLVQLIEKGEALLKASPVLAELDFENSQPLAEILFVQGRYLIECEVEARAGHVIELELEDGN
ncbi:MAG: hypothetical protein DWQ01_08875 [Planctomycetota bacterium]|nr:MAG: hypothetical protein DWQ01_08875 [Planctomycetota bacterium]